MRRFLLWIGMVFQAVPGMAYTDESSATTVPVQPDRKSAKADPKLVEAIREAGGQINRFEDGRIVFVGFYEPKARASSRFAFLKKLDHLQELVVSHTASAEWMESISELPELRTLTTYRCKMTDQSLGHVKTVKSLRTLELDVSPITDAGLEALVSLPHLEKLMLRHLSVTDEGLKTIARLPQLKTLSLIELNITPAGIFALRDSPVEELYWWDEDRSHLAFLPYIKKLKNLKRIRLSSEYVTDEVAEHLREIKTLELLDLHDHRLSEKGLRKLSELTNLRELNLSLGFEQYRRDYADPLRDPGPGLLTRLKRLQVLSLSKTSVTDAGLRHVAKLTQLRKLYLSHTKVSATGLAALGALQHLETLDITAVAAHKEPRIDLHLLKNLKTVYAYEADEQKILVPNGCVVITFD